MTDKTDVTRREYIAECAEWADKWAANLRRDLERATRWYDPDLDRDGIQLPLPEARAKKLIEGLEAIDALLRDLQAAQ